MTGDRIRFREILRQARANSVLALAATHAALEKTEHRAATSFSDERRSEQQFDQVIADQESATLFAIDGLLELLRDRSDSYGVCEKCGVPILLARLRFPPWTSRCEKHAEEQIQ
ncbi:MAG: TraR/DksA family transcriptional regulator [Gemmatimonadaceae bacterium]